MATATVGTWGNGQGVRLPVAICRSLGIEPGDELDITVRGNVICMTKPQRLPESLSELFEGYSGPYRPEEWDIGEPVGREMW